jgi:hypothetical protein
MPSHVPPVHITAKKGRFLDATWRLRALSAHIGQEEALFGPVEVAPGGNLAVMCAGRTRNVGGAL